MSSEVQIKSILLREEALASLAEFLNRRYVFECFEQVIKDWGVTAGFAANDIEVFLFGSTGCGIADSASDLDTSLFVRRKDMHLDIFKALSTFLRSRTDVYDLVCAKFNKLPLLKFTYLTYAFDLVILVMEDLPSTKEEFLDPARIDRLDQPQRIPYMGVVIPFAMNDSVGSDFDGFARFVAVVRHYAKSQLIYGASTGFLNGISYALLARYVYITNSGASPNTIDLVHSFFTVLSTKNWPIPIEIGPRKKFGGIAAYEPDPMTEAFAMPILSPIYPYISVSSGLGRCESSIIKTSFALGAALSKEVFLGRRPITDLFAKRDFFNSYGRYVTVEAKVARLKLKIGITSLKYVIRSLADHLLRYPAVESYHLGLQYDVRGTDSNGEWAIMKSFIGLVLKTGHTTVDDFSLRAFHSDLKSAVSGLDNELLIGDLHVTGVRVWTVNALEEERKQWGTNARACVTSVTPKDTYLFSALIDRVGVNYLQLLDKDKSFLEATLRGDGSLAYITSKVYHVHNNFWIIVIRASIDDGPVVFGELSSRLVHTNNGEPFITLLEVEEIVSDDLLEKVYRTTRIRPRLVQHPDLPLAGERVVEFAIGFKDVIKEFYSGLLEAGKKV